MAGYLYPEDKYFVIDTENGVPKSALYDTDDDNNDSDGGNNSCQQPSEVGYGKTFTRVWLWAIAPAKKDVGPQDVTYGTTIKGLVWSMSQFRSGSRGVAHNASYDFPMILTELIDEGFRDVTDPEGQLTRSVNEREAVGDKMSIEEFVKVRDSLMGEEFEGKDGKKHRGKPRGTYSTIITDKGKWYQLVITFFNGRTITLTDSYKIIPLSVDRIGAAFKTRSRKLKGSIQYDLYRPVAYKPTNKEIEYIKHDVLVIAEALYELSLRTPDLTKCLTLGVACMKDFKSIIGKNAYEILFPQLDEEIDAALRKAYNGGWCYDTKRNPHVVHNSIVTFTGGRLAHHYDVNSEYPWAMYRKEFPTGEPRDFKPRGGWSKWQGSAEDALSLLSGMPYFLRFTSVFKLKPDHHPFVQLKKHRYVADEYVEDSVEAVELTLCRPDFELFLEQYDVSFFDVHQVWAFDSSVGIFDEYIEKWYKLKAEAGNEVDRQLAKLMLNNLYGKFGQGFDRTGGKAYLDGRVMHYERVENVGLAGHIPTGAYVTAYARGKVVRAAQLNYDTFLYADTDSLILTDEAVGIFVDNDELGAWKLETKSSKVRIVRQKTYIELVEMEWVKNPVTKEKEFVNVEPYLNIKAAGATDLVKERMQYKLTAWDGSEFKHKRLVRDADDKPIAEKRPIDHVFERFTFGLKEAGKLTRRSVDNGPVLIDSTFTVHVPQGFVVNPLTGICPSIWTNLTY